MEARVYKKHTATLGQVCVIHNSPSHSEGVEKSRQNKWLPLTPQQAVGKPYPKSPVRESRQPQPTGHWHRESQPTHEAKITDIKAGNNKGAGQIQSRKLKQMLKSKHRTAKTVSITTWPIHNVTAQAGTKRTH